VPVGRPAAGGCKSDDAYLPCAPRVCARAPFGALAGYRVQAFADSIAAQRAEFEGVKEFIERYLRRTELACRARSESGYNNLTLEVITMTRYLVHFGFYDFDEMLRLTDVLLAILDSRHISRYGHQGGPRRERFAYRRHTSN